MIATKENICWVDWEKRVISFRDLAHAELQVFEEREKMLKYVLDAVEQGFRIQ
ncbi:hypothetical protein [Intestinimonas butyriciproducens]|uniref:hypothetical protein n=1 Tax=Intestinimonas butyriciproducens TaxID=1297617 RepID=UPI001AB0344E|nr:hypothetical protein [Intestinimonas butyriciproducens]MBO3279188.1 hypothetical protein [Intestinimonas butyriciproducens]